MIDSEEHEIIVWPGNYTIPELIEYFNKDANEFTPHQFNNDSENFNFTRSLEVICREIQKIKEVLNEQAQQAQPGLHRKPHSRCC